MIAIEDILYFLPVTIKFDIISRIKFHVNENSWLMEQK